MSVFDFHTPFIMLGGFTIMISDYSDSNKSRGGSTKEGVGATPPANFGKN